jgi:hypothetical protein
MSSHVPVLRLRADEDIRPSIGSTVKPFHLRMLTRESGVGTVGYYFIKAKEDGSWRITEKTGKEHRLAGEGETPEGLSIAVEQDLDKWIVEQRRIHKHNMGVLERAPERLDGRNNRRGVSWKSRERVKEHAMLYRAEATYAKTLEVALAAIRDHGWPVGTQSSPLPEGAANSYLVAGDDQ